jgi:hypothetical protein
MNEENDKPIEISGPGWTVLPNGSLELLVNCNSYEDYLALPSTLVLQGRPLAKCGWIRAEGVVRYRSGWDTIEEAIKNLM